MEKAYPLWRLTWLQDHWLPWLLPLGALLTLTGYFGPWIPHRVAGLVITGLDLGEYVKFLPVVRSGQVTVWREGFYLPLVAVSLALTLAAFRAQWRYGWPMRVLLLAVATIATLNLLPPAWNQSTFRNPEFRLQLQMLLVCLGGVAFSPFLVFLPRRLSNAFTVLLSAGALWFSLRDFLRVLPAIQELYNHPLQPGWGIYLLALGLLFMVAIHLADFLAPMTTRRRLSKSMRPNDHATTWPRD